MGGSPMRLRFAALLLLGSLAPARPAGAGKCPNMLILLDRSGSMQGYKWTAALEAVAAFAPAHEEAIRFGLMVFPAPSESCGGGLALLPCDFFAATAIARSLSGTRPGGMTPTAEAIATAGRLADLADPTRPRFLLLITDGDPTCPDDRDEEANLVLAVTATGRLASQGIRTFVIGFGQAVSPDRLDRLAEAGGAPRAGATCADPKAPGRRIPCRYYDAADRASLGAALDEIASVAQGELGGRTCDDSCYGIEGCPQGQRCVQQVHRWPPDRAMNLGRCEPDPCASLDCGGDAFCREGVCHPVCTTPCALPQVCRDGACVDDPCAADPTRCACAEPCERFLVCVDGTCLDDPCRSVRCPASAPFCSTGSCFAGAGTRTDKSGDPVSGGGKKGGCDSSGAVALWPIGALPLTLALGSGPRRRRRGPGDVPAGG